MVHHLTYFPAWHIFIVDSIKTRLVCKVLKNISASALLQYPPLRRNLIGFTSVPHQFLLSSMAFYSP